MKWIVWLLQYTINASVGLPLIFHIYIKTNGSIARCLHLCWMLRKLTDVVNRCWCLYCSLPLHISVCVFVCKCRCACWCLCLALCVLVPVPVPVPLPVLCMAFCFCVCAYYRSCCALACGPTIAAVQHEHTIRRLGIVQIVR